jgi:hypothetical protein
MWYQKEFLTGGYKIPTGFLLLEIVTAVRILSLEIVHLLADYLKVFYTDANFTVMEVLRFNTV